MSTCLFEKNVCFEIEKGNRLNGIVKDKVHAKASLQDTFTQDFYLIEENKTKKLYLVQPFRIKQILS